MAAIVSPSAARVASRSPPASTSPSQASAICAATYVLHETVASSPACVSTGAVASRASGLSAVFVRPIVTTPAPAHRLEQPHDLGAAAGLRDEHEQRARGEQPSLVVEQLRGLHADRGEPRLDEPQVQRDEAEVRRAHARQHHAAQVAVAQPSRDVLERGGRLEAAVSLRERVRLIEDVAKVRRLP